MDIQKWKIAKKKKGLSYDDLAKITGYSRSTITNIFCGYIEFPRYETIQAIERALEIDEEKPTMSPKKTTTPANTPAPADEYSDEEKRLVGAYRVLPEGKRLFLLEMIEKFAAEERGSGHGNKWNRG